MFVSLATRTQLHRFLELFLRARLLAFFRCRFRRLCRLLYDGLLADRVDANLLEVGPEKLDELLLLFKVVGDGLASQLALLVLGGLDAASRHLVGEHERNEAEDDGLHRPRGVPRLGVVVRERRADRIVNLEAPLWRVKLNPGWLERIVAREQ